MIQIPEGDLPPFPHPIRSDLPEPPSKTVLVVIAIARGYVASTPLPRTFPKPLQPFVPYVYSHEELKRLLSAVVANDNPRSVIDPTTFRLLLLMLYGAGLRISEALRLTLADVDLTTAVLHIRESKFYKTRLVPIGSDLTRLLIPYATARHRNHATPSSRSSSPVAASP